MNRGPTIGEAMTPQPVSVRPEHEISHAKTLMIKHSIKHLPVTRDGHVVGVLTDRDIKLRQAVSASGDFHASALVHDAMVPGPFVVQKSKPLADVLKVMVDGKIGSAIVVDPDQKLLGIFTSMDACKTLLEVYQEQSE